MTNRPKAIGTAAETVPAHHETPDLAELRRLAEAATPGPWRTEYLMGAGNDLLTAIIAGRATPDDLRVIGSTLAERDGKFVAAASPAVVLALLDERDALAAKVERVWALHCREDATTNGQVVASRCPRCMAAWPCPTIRALDTTPDAGGES